jgi:hypothetical protein
MSTCMLKGFCTVLAKQLHEVGVDDTAVSTTYQDSFPCDAVLENSRLLFQHVDPSNAAAVSRFIQRLFPGTPVEPTDTTADFLLHQQPFRCTELDIEVYQPCSVKSCAFWTANAWTRNCILDYRITFANDHAKDHTRGQLEPKDLAFLLGLGLPNAKQKVNDAIAAARYWALKNRLSTAAAAESAGLVETQPENPENPQDPPESAEEEIIHRRFGIGATRVLAIAVQSFATVKSAAQAVDVPPDVFLTLCMHHGIVATHLL